MLMYTFYKNGNQPQSYGESPLWEIRRRGLPIPVVDVHAASSAAADILCLEDEVGTLSAS